MQLFSLHCFNPPSCWFQDIEVTKSRAVYKRYVAEVPIAARSEYFNSRCNHHSFSSNNFTLILPLDPSDPRTPNKYLKHSRRGWDGQYKKWKKSLYVWAGEEYTASNASSRADSRAESHASDEDGGTKLDLDSENSIEEKLNKLRPEKLNFGLEHPDNMASLLGHFDLNTRQGTLLNDESTLKATNSDNRSATAPMDFSELHH